MARKQAAPAPAPEPPPAPSSATKPRTSRKPVAGELSVRYELVPRRQVSESMTMQISKGELGDELKRRGWKCFVELASRSVYLDTGGSRLLCVSMDALLLAMLRA